MTCDISPWWFLRGSQPTRRPPPLALADTAPASQSPGPAGPGAWQAPGWNNRLRIWTPSNHESSRKPWALEPRILEHLCGSKQSPVLM